MLRRRWGYSQVAPYAGAWIETKLAIGLGEYTDVAPYAGAWIETPSESPSKSVALVAPYAGAWIETSRSYATALLMWSPLMQGRGLKLKLA